MRTSTTMDELGATSGNQSGVGSARTMWSAIFAIAAVVARCLTVAAVLSVSFGGLAYLSALQRVATRSLQADPHIVGYASSVAIACMAPFCLSALIGELQIAVLLSGQWAWSLCRALLPWSFALLGGVFAYLLFPPEEPGPKQTMLVLGGALAGFLASLVHLGLRSESTISAESSGWPTHWTIALIMMTAGFLGALRGWTGPSAQFRGVMTYQSKRWPEGRKAPPTPLKPADDVRFY